jgi:hypothetical protein
MASRNILAPYAVQNQKQNINIPLALSVCPMKQHALKTNHLNTNSYLETSGGESSNPYLNSVQFFNTRVY